MSALLTSPLQQPAGAEALARFVMHILDEIDYGVALVREGAFIVYANYVARSELRQAGLFEESGEPPRISCGLHTVELHQVIGSALNLSKRRMVTLRKDQRTLTCAVAPLSRALGHGEPLALLLFGRQNVCEKLSVHWYGVTHGLTPMEGAVLEALCAGLEPHEIAAAHRVSITTVRTQIASLRDKTGVHSVNKLLRQVALLPPLVPALRLVEA